MKKVKVIGAGLAGCEAAWQLSKRGICVELIEMKPKKKSPAHSTDGFAEIVCSNSLKSNDITNACGLLKQELRMLGSLLIECADACRVEAGTALAVDRDLFSERVTKAIKGNSLIEVSNCLCDEVPKSDCIVATGPLTDSALTESITRLTGSEFLYFFDAAAPIVLKDSIDFSSAFYASRYNKGSADYINCPMNKEEYIRFYEALINAKRAEVKDFESDAVFEGCMPVEIMAERGEDTLRFGPLKPVGLVDDRTKAKNYAVLQLRKETLSEEMYNLVGFQTHLTFSEQKRVFGLIPALANAEYVRYGVMHRNMFLNAPSLLDESYMLKGSDNVYFAGQISGVEGYVESIASGMIAGINLAAKMLGQESLVFSDETVIGALARYISKADATHFQPMNSNFAIVRPLNEIIKDKAKKKQAYADRSLACIDKIIKERDII